VISYRHTLCVIMLVVCAFIHIFAEEELSVTAPPVTRITKSPTKALFMGLLIPGSGDFYCKKYTKGVIFFTAGAALGYQMYYYYQEQKDAYDVYLRYKAAYTQAGDEALLSKVNSAYADYTGAYNTMQTYMYYYLINLAISTLDGVVEAYLYDWHVNDVHIKSSAEEGSVSLFLSKGF